MHADVMFIAWFYAPGPSEEDPGPREEPGGGQTRQGDSWRVRICAYYERVCNELCGNAGPGVPWSAKCVEWESNGVCWG